MKILFAVNSLSGLSHLSKLLSNDHLSPEYPLSDVPREDVSFFFKQQIFKNQRVEALKDLIKLLESVRAHEEKYRDRFSPHSYYYRRHIVVQQFLQAKLTTELNQTPQCFSCNVARLFDRSTFTACNIVC